jgi:hypothetical protein
MHGWLLQPFFQYVFRPSGGVPNPNDPTGLARIKDAAIFGLTTTLKYRSSEGGSEREHSRRPAQ